MIHHKTQKIVAIFVEMLMDDMKKEDDKRVSVGVHM